VTRVPFLAPTFPSPSVVAKDYAAIVRHGIFTNSGPVERAFATSLASWIGPGVAVSLVSSCTAGLELAIRAVFLAGREFAVVPSFTFAAGPLAIRRCGYTPVFVDIGETSWQPDLDDAEAFLTREARHVAGILLATTFGVANEEVKRWEALAHLHGLPLVIDSAAGFGSVYSWGERVGARGDCEVFSLHATKTLAIGEGGAVAARDSAITTTIDQLKNFGFDSRRQAVLCGTNAKLSELSAAIGLRQLEVLTERLERRHRILAKYKATLPSECVAFQPGAERSALPFVSALLRSHTARDALVEALDEAEVECRIYYNPPVHSQPIFADASSCAGLETTGDVAGRIISLPMSDRLRRQTIARIGEVAQAVLRG